MLAIFLLILGNLDVLWILIPLGEGVNSPPLPAYPMHALSPLLCPAGSHGYVQPHTEAGGDS